MHEIIKIINNVIRFAVNPYHVIQAIALMQAGAILVLSLAMLIFPLTMLVVMLDNKFSGSLKMDIIVQINDEIEQKARRRAQGEGFSSVPGWVSHLVTREVQEDNHPENLSLLEILADETTADRDVKFPRAQDSLRGVDFD